MATHRKSTDAISARDAAFWSMGPSSTDLVTKAYTAWLDQANKVNDEAFRFAHDRLVKDLEAAAHLVRCSEPNEALTVQMEFASKMAADYLAEGQKMLELVSQLAKETHLERGQDARGAATRIEGLCCGATSWVRSAAHEGVMLGISHLAQRTKFVDVA